MEWGGKDLGLGGKMYVIGLSLPGLLGEGGGGMGGGGGG